MNRIASLHLLESGNLELDVLGKFEDDDIVPCDVLRLSAFMCMQNDKRLTDLLDQFIAADKGGVE
jgi:hypothetical protein